MERKFLIYFNSKGSLITQTFPAMFMSEPDIGAFIVRHLWPIHGNGTYNAVDVFDGHVYLSLTLNLDEVD